MLDLETNPMGVFNLTVYLLFTDEYEFMLNTAFTAPAIKFMSVGWPKSLLIRAKFVRELHGIVSLDLNYIKRNFPLECLQKADHRFETAVLITSDKSPT